MRRCTSLPTNSPQVTGRRHLLFRHLRLLALQLRATLIALSSLANVLYTAASFYTSLSNLFSHLETFNVKR